MGRSRDSDARSGNHVVRVHRCAKANVPAAAKIQTVIMAADAERLGKFSRSRTQGSDWVQTSTALHRVDTLDWLNRAEEDEPFFMRRSQQDVEEPVDAVVQVNVSGSDRMSGDEGSCALPEKRVTSFVIPGRVGFRLDDDSSASPPDQFTTNYFRRARAGIAFEKAAREKGR